MIGSPNGNCCGLPAISACFGVGSGRINGHGIVRWAVADNAGAGVTRGQREGTSAGHGAAVAALEANRRLRVVVGTRLAVGTCGGTLLSVTMIANDVITVCEAIGGHIGGARCRAMAAAIIEASGRAI